MISNPLPVLQALFDNLRLPPFDDFDARLTMLNGDQMQFAVELAVEEFSKYVSESSVRSVLRFASDEYSFGIVAGEMVVGAYLVSVNSLRLRGSNFPSLANRPGLQGDALVVHPMARGQGFGRLLREMLPQVGRIVGADYVFGGALYELENLNHWLRRRVLVHSSGGVHLTVEPIAADLKEALLPLANEPLRDRWIEELGINTIAVDSFTQGMGP